ncbi:helix-turn-helix domain-containing protein [Paenibacillus thiaminolyticus]|uniref:helix-turn-helix domain-containing protein n=1 Tax=Paenibacillus thiaminolyticus TaxID=49283 RepID=UPI002330D58D|nr:helix-turn-helix transcriptional regulator [Paenibacillus thiaminolyticus]WCF05928.1 helix-turn-helix domain-containing protein [Paenibacillus thiaminolyticus]
MSKDKKVSKDKNRYDFHAIGQAIKEARGKQGMTREQLAEKIDISARNMAGIENYGRHPRFQKFYELVTMLNISVDEEGK